MAWDLDGVDQYARFSLPVALQTAPGGPLTMAFLVHLDATTDGAILHIMSGTTSFTFAEVFGTWNYGTTAGTRTGPAATASAWYIVIVTKNTGNVAPEYTLIPLATGVPTSGTMTGGGATLGNGLSAGAAGFIQMGRFGTSALEYLNGRVAAAVIYTAYKAQAAREAMTTWGAISPASGWLGESGLAWAMEFQALTSRVDASGNGGNETARFGTASITLAADPSGFFSSSSAVNVADSPAGYRLRSGYEAVSSGLAVADSPAGARWRSPEGSGTFTGVQAALDVPNGLRLRSGYESVTSGVAIPDAPNGLRLRSGADTTTQPITAQDSPGGLRWRSGYESVSLGGSPVSVADGVPDGYRLRSVGGAAVLGVLTTDLPTGWRLRSAQETISSGLTVADLPAGFRLRSGSDSALVSVGNPTDWPGGWRWGAGATSVVGAVVTTPEVTIVAEVDTLRVVTEVSNITVDAGIGVLRITAPVRRLQA